MNHVSSGAAVRARRNPMTSILRIVSLLVALIFVASACQSGTDDGLGSEGNLDPALAIGVDLSDDDSESPSRARVLAATGSSTDDEESGDGAETSDTEDSDDDDGETTDSDVADEGTDADDTDDSESGDPDTDGSESGSSDTGSSDSDDSSDTTPERSTSTTAQETSTTAPSTTAAPTTTAPTTAAPTTASPDPGSGGRFETLPVGATLPSGTACASRVQPAPETRSMNADYNARRGTSSNGRYPRVDGNYVGTTDEIIQWAACKWGLDEDVARAQAAKESWWGMHVGGDRTTDQSACHPDLRTGAGSECPESIGLLQVRWLYHKEAFEDSNAIRSTAYNVDYAFAVWRDCFEGNLTWLGSDYVAGDADGCLGVWFTGRWYPSDAPGYIAAVHDLRSQKIWEQSNFKAWEG